MYYSPRILLSNSPTIIARSTSINGFLDIPKFGCPLEVAMLLPCWLFIRAYTLATLSDLPLSDLRIFIIFSGFDLFERGTRRPVILQSMGDHSLVVFDVCNHWYIDRIQIDVRIPILVEMINELDRVTARTSDELWIVVPGPEGEGESDGFLLADSRFHGSTNSAAGQAE